MLRLAWRLPAWAGLVDAGVHAHGQAVAGLVDLRPQVGQAFARVAQHMQHRAEDLALQFAEVLDLDQHRRHAGAPQRLHRRGGDPRRPAGSARSAWPAPHCR
jgi:hypothetical protein